MSEWTDFIFVKKHITSRVRRPKDNIGKICKHKQIITKIGFQKEQELRVRMPLVMRDWIQSSYINHASRNCAYSQTCQSTRNPPNSPKEIRTGPVISIMYLELLLILPIKFHSNLSTPRVFQDFCFPTSTLYVPRSDSNWKWSI